MRRRSFLGLAGSALSVDPAGGAPAGFPVIDTHIHLLRRRGVSPEPALPGHYRELVAGPLGFAGAIAVEASDEVEENRRVLDAAGEDALIVGYVGNLEPDKPEFGRQLESLHRNPLFRGIRYGNLFGRDIAAAVDRPVFIAGLRLLAAADLSLDAANPDLALLGAMLKISDRVPGLRLIVDHLPRMAVDPAERARKDSLMREFRKRPQVYAKVTQVIHTVDGRIPKDLEYHRPRLDEIFETFGEDRVLYGSDWPNSDRWAPPEVGYRMLRSYFTAKGAETAARFFWRNSINAYNWLRRDPGQPGAGTA